MILCLMVVSQFLAYFSLTIICPKTPSKRKYVVMLACLFNQQPFLVLPSGVSLSQDVA
eukprot:m.64105 g.64105  ORF g.64105 m.64105 type:complete len:58 (+) comp35217_c0_seq6:188-361(+)